MKRAPPEERERLRREMENKTASKTPGRPSWKAVHLLSAEEVQSLFSDVVEGLAFLVREGIPFLTFILRSCTAQQVDPTP